MKMSIEPTAVYLHRDPVDFRKQIDGLAASLRIFISSLMRWRKGVEKYGLMLMGYSPI